MTQCKTLRPHFSHPSRNNRYLTGAVGLRSRPGPVGLTQPGGGAGEQVAVHAGVDDSVRKRRSVQAEHSAIAGRARVTALNSWGETTRERLRRASCISITCGSATNYPDSKSFRTPRRMDGHIIGSIPRFCFWIGRDNVKKNLSLTFTKGLRARPGPVGEAHPLRRADQIKALRAAEVNLGADPEIRLFPRALGGNARIATGTSCVTCRGRGWEMDSQMGEGER